MSHAQDHANDAPHDGPHEGPIKTPTQLIVTVFFSFVVPIITIIMLTNYVAFGDKGGAGTDALGAEQVAARIMPVGAVKLKPADGGVLKTGEQVFQAQCSACHAAGLVGAPKFGDAAAWAPRIKTGYEALLTSALKGKGAMGAQGGGELSDIEVGRGVVYMANNGGAKFDEPQPPAAAASSTPK
jgi:cytochrome c5